MTSENQFSDRRRFVRKLVSLGAALGVVGLVGSQLKGPAELLPVAQAASGGNIIINAANDGETGTTTLTSTTASDHTFKVVNQADAGRGVSGFATNLSGGVTFGVYGLSDSNAGRGVLGYATHANGATYGVYGLSDSIAGTGVYGSATNASGATTGVYAQSNSIAGTGVYGSATNASGATYGVYALSNSIDGQGVLGWASNASGFTTGVFGQSSSIAGTGAIGYASNASGFTDGVVGASDSISGRGVYGVASNASGGTYGVYGLSNSVQGISVLGQAGSFGARPMLAQGASGQTASLQEWRNSSGTPLAVVDANGRLGIGTASPARSIHLQNNNAVFRMDRDANSSAFILVRTAAGDFTTIWKTFYVGVDASGVNNGSFFVGDVGSAVSGASTKRLVIDNTGLVGVGRTPTANNLEVEGTASKTTAGSWLANSDMRIKTDVGDIDDALATIRKLHPVRFRYADWYRAKHPSIKDHSYYNFIAQEYREVFPDSVQDGGEGLLQMDSHNAIPYLVRAVQELTQQNETREVAFENGYKVTEDEKAGLAFKNHEGEKIAVLDHEGNWHIKGKVLEDL